MKFYSILFILAFSLSGLSCKTGNQGNNSKSYSGTIEATGITSYQYGTHTLQAENEFYALKSEVIDLSNYEGKNVTISATKIEGYPVDGGPVYLNVKEIKD